VSTSIPTLPITLSLSLPHPSVRPERGCPQPYQLYHGLAVVFACQLTSDHHTHPSDTGAPEAASPDTASASGSSPPDTFPPAQTTTDETGAPTLSPDVPTMPASPPVDPNAVPPPSPVGTFSPYSNQRPPFEAQRVAIRIACARLRLHTSIPDSLDAVAPHPGAFLPTYDPFYHPALVQYCVTLALRRRKLAELISQWRAGRL
jgi:hypothetical protein